MENGFSIDSDSDDVGSRARVAARDSMFLQATLKSERGKEALPLRVRNLSAGGLMGEVTGQLDRHDIVEIEMRGIGKIVGRVAWRQDHRVGIAFDKAIDPKLARKPVGTGKPVAQATSKPIKPILS